MAASARQTSGRIRRRDARVICKRFLVAPYVIADCGLRIADCGLRIAGQYPEREGGVVLYCGMLPTARGTGSPIANKKKEGRAFLNTPPTRPGERDRSPR